MKLFSEQAKTVNDAVPALRVLEGEEESTYWSKVFESMNAKKSWKPSKKRSADKDVQSESKRSEIEASEP